MKESPLFFSESTRPDIKRRGGAMTCKYILSQEQRQMHSGAKTNACRSKRKGTGSRCRRNFHPGARGLRCGGVRSPKEG